MKTGLSKEETWKDIRGFKGIYQVSDQGQVKRIEPGRATRIGRILKPGIRPKGYACVSLCHNGKRKESQIHRLVALAFLGPAKGRQVNHKNGRKTDNRAANLEWVTAAENMRHSREVLGIDPTRTGEGHGASRLTSKQVKDIRLLYARGEHTQKSLGKMFGVVQSTIQAIVTGKTWRHVWL